MAVQLRRYTVADPEGLDRLVAWFPQLVPVREKYGFTIEWAYADRENLQFLWAVSYDGSAADFEDAVKPYEVSPERTAAFADFDNPIIEVVVGFADEVG